jgi:hypothetical protein
MRGQPEESTGSLLDGKSRSELSDILLGYKESKIGPCGGVDTLQNEKKRGNTEPERERENTLQAQPSEEK